MKRKLFAFDLDGTLLGDGTSDVVSPKTVKMVKRLQKEGHVVCILTGRPWRATETIYKQLGLKTLVANYNGGHIHNPTDYGFIPTSERVVALNALNIISHEKTKLIAQNIILETSNKLLISKKPDENLSDFLHIGPKTKIKANFKWSDIASDPIGVLIQVKPKYKKDIKMITNYFRSIYGDTSEFSSWTYGENNEVILDVTNKAARKDIALIRMARYYKISMDDVIAFGDGGNDTHMLDVAGVGVAMQNSSDSVKEHANVISKHTNKKDGVAKFLFWYLEKGHKKVKKTIYDFERKADFIEQVIAED